MLKYKPGTTVNENAPEIEAAMRAAAFEKIEEALKSCTQAVSLADLVAEAEKNKGPDTLMFYI